MKHLFLFSLLALVASASVIQLPAIKKVIYVDYQPVNWNNPADTTNALVDMGYNVIILAFWLNSGPADFAQVWAAAPPDQRQAAIDYAHQHGAIIMVSCAGSTESPYTYDANAYGSSIGRFAAGNLLDGIDFDLENFGPGFVAAGKNAQEIQQWLSTSNAAARNAFASARGVQPVISHAPQAPYFGKVGDTNSWAGSTGGYSGVEQNADVDFYNVQFYNQGATCYVDYQGLFENSANCPAFPGTSVKEIQSYGIPLSKIVVGKPLLQADASNGWVSPASLKSFVDQAKASLGWNAGVMFWMFHGTDQASARDAIKTIYP